MERLNEFLDEARIGTYITLIGAIGALIAFVLGDLDYLEFAAALGLSGVGGGAIGKARADSGHGTGPASRKIKAEKGSARR